MYSYTDNKKEFIKMTLLGIPETVKALWDCNEENVLIKDKQIFFTDFLKSVTLEEFENIQTTHLFQVRIFSVMIMFCSFIFQQICDFYTI